MVEARSLEQRSRECCGRHPRLPGACTREGFFACFVLSLTWAPLRAGCMLCSVCEKKAALRKSEAKRLKQKGRRQRQRQEEEQYVEEEEDEVGSIQAVNQHLANTAEGKVASTPQGVDVVQRSTADGTKEAEVKWHVAIWRYIVDMFDFGEQEQAPKTKSMLRRARRRARLKGYDGLPNDQSLCDNSWISEPDA